MLFKQYLSLYKDTQIKSKSNKKFLYKYNLFTHFTLNTYYIYHKNTYSCSYAIDKLLCLSNLKKEFEYTLCIGNVKRLYLSKNTMIIHDIDTEFLNDI